MLSKARAGEIDIIYTKSISRFARNTLLLLQVVRELRAIDVAIIFEEKDFDTADFSQKLKIKQNTSRYAA